MSFKQESKTVILRRKENNKVKRSSVEVEVKTNLGAFSRGRDVGRGLSFEEEIKYLPSIIGINQKSEKWEEATKTYWANFSVKVPADGLKLEVGMKEIDGIKSPIHLNDYIIYRFALEHGQVANSIDLAEKSPKIRFYLYDESIDKEIRQTTFNTRMEAVELFLTKRNDAKEPNFVKNMAAILAVEDLVFREYETMSPNDLSMTLGQYAEREPSAFIKLANDVNLKAKSFINRCIAKNFLKKISNTTIITNLDGEPIGNTIDEAISYLQTSHGDVLYKELQNKMKAL